MTVPGRGNAPIVAGVEGTEAASRAVRWAAVTAARHGAPLHLVHAAGLPDLYVGVTVPPPASCTEQLRTRHWELLLAAREVADGVAGVDLHLRLEPDPPVPFLLRASRTARMIVLGSSGHTGLTGLLVGSTALALATHAQCPVVSVRGHNTEVGAGDRRPVVVGIDGSPISEQAIGAGFDEACFRGVELVAVHTWSDANTDVFGQERMHVDWEPLRDAEERQLAERLAGWRECYPDVAVRRVLTKDRPRRELLEWSRKAQLVVVGSRGRGGFRGMLLGSTSQALLHHAGCPVMIARCVSVDGPR
jgi:nucleotide-binding universal stress UspA family protein